MFCFSSGVFSSSGNVKARLLTKILIEATILCEQVGLYLDYICCDGAPWNRSMWNILEIRATLNDIQCRVVHPCDKHRFLYIILDFPHLMKCVRNTMMNHGFNTHSGRAHWEHVSTMWKLDNSAITLKVTPKLARSHIFPNGFEKICLSFCSLVKSPKGGNVADGVVESVWSVEEMLHKTEDGEEDNERLPSDALEVSIDHASYTAERSDSRLVYYVAGYVARKRILSNNCD
ncbi:uncharacterized protein LOC119173676 [Rhipicephalus microplus]|uniref:uncharacterized protein LOC119173676 n=1 Tax=Rhipicephalus microplus TaxID=6941 RepID=UPI003F6C2880